MPLPPPPPVSGDDFADYGDGVDDYEDRYIADPDEDIDGEIAAVTPSAVAETSGCVISRRGMDVAVTPSAASPKRF